MWTNRGKYTITYFSDYLQQPIPRSAIRLLVHEVKTLEGKRAAAKSEDEKRVLEEDITGKVTVADNICFADSSLAIDLTGMLACNTLRNRASHRHGNAVVPLC